MTQPFRIATDTGGTFTDLVLEHRGRLQAFKASTTPQDPVAGVLDAVALAAESVDLTVADLLRQTDIFIHGTTHPLNAVLTRQTAKTALLATAGHPDVLLFREGGRRRPFDHSRPFPDPYVPRSLTWEITERIDSTGSVVTDLDEACVIEALSAARDRGVEAVAVCFLWSIANSAHEQRVGELIAEHLPGVPYSLSYELNPTLREYRRASSTAIDASLKPLMAKYIGGLEGRLKGAGFRGRTLVVTSTGGVLDAEDAAAAPVHLLNSGPAMAPIAGRHFAELDASTDTAIIADTGGTSYDVSLVRKGAIPRTRETWLGEPYLGHMTGFHSVDVQSVGAGGGSIAWVDEGGLLRVGPQSAGSSPGPVCYGRGGELPTVTDASAVLGFLDPDYFLGGTMTLHLEGARDALQSHIAEPLGLTVEAAAAAVLALATEHMVRAIEDMTVNQGIDPADAVLLGGGGAAGLNVVAVARRLGCATAVVPCVGAVLSAAGALLSDLSHEYATTFYGRTDDLDTEKINAELDGLVKRSRAFAASAGSDQGRTSIQLLAELRYPHQIWDMEVPLPVDRFSGLDDVQALREAFHQAHHDMFAISDPDSEVEVVSLRARVSCRLRDHAPDTATADGRPGSAGDKTRPMYFATTGWAEGTIWKLDELIPDEVHLGPGVVESPFTTVVIDPGARMFITQNGGLRMQLPQDACTGSFRQPATQETIA